MSLNTTIFALHKGTLVEYDGKPPKGAEVFHDGRGEWALLGAVRGLFGVHLAARRGGRPHKARPDIRGQLVRLEIEHLRALRRWARRAGRRDIEAHVAAALHLVSWGVVDVYFGSD